jgi:ketosteroid isomerase-like protein
MACGSETVESPPAVPADWHSLNAHAAATAMVPTANERAIAETYVAALSSPSLAKVGPMFEEMGHIAFGRKDARGRDRVQQVHERLFGSFDDRKSFVTRVWRTNDMQMVEWILSGTQSREWLGVPPTQRPVVIRGMTVLSTQDDGTLTDAHIYFNVAVVKAELGIGPKELQDYVATLPAPVALQAKPVAVDQAGSPTEKQNVIVIRASLDALEQNKEADYLDAFADAVQIETPGHAKTQKKEDVRSYYRMMRRAIGQLDTTILSIRGIVDFVIVEYTISGEQYAPVGYVPVPPDHEARLDIVDVVEMHDGKIAHVWRYDGPDWPQQ